MENTVIPTVPMTGMHTIIAELQDVHRQRITCTIPAEFRVVWKWETIQRSKQDKRNRLKCGFPGKGKLNDKNTIRRFAVYLLERCQKERTGKGTFRDGLGTVFEL